MGTNDHDAAGPPSPLLASPLLRRWLACVGVDAAVAVEAAWSLPRNQWLVGPPALQGTGSGATFRLTGQCLEANFTHGGVEYAVLGAHVVLVAPGILPATTAVAATGRPLVEVIDTPITRREYASIVTVRSVAAGGGRSIIVAACPMEPLAGE